MERSEIRPRVLCVAREAWSVLGEVGDIMDIRAVFGLSILMSFVAFGLTTKLYILPRLRILPRDDALVPLIVPHAFRFIGLSFLVPGVVSPSLPSAFAAHRRVRRLGCGRSCRDGNPRGHRESLLGHRGRVGV